MRHYSFLKQTLLRRVNEEILVFLGDLNLTLKKSRSHADLAKFIKLTFFIDILRNKSREKNSNLFKLKIQNIDKIWPHKIYIAGVIFMVLYL